ncbi:hypothetical protein GEV33_010073 [Tenebrio molitor]|uniref:Uncharacterized protein n=1 Tax=Tenebrio molitor TaxID=7067 RepID=A0A8J6HFI9_TENMO|nr:hypothetical protein GEV33_010073 [Tenebrio molitor]
MTFDVYGLTAEEAAPYVNANKSKRTGYLTTQFLNATYNYFATETKLGNFLLSSPGLFFLISSFTHIIFDLPQNNAFVSRTLQRQVRVPTGATAGSLRRATHNAPRRRIHHRQKPPSPESRSPASGSDQHRSNYGEKLACDSYIENLFNRTCENATDLKIVSTAAATTECKSFYDRNAPDQIGSVPVGLFYSFLTGHPRAAPRTRRARRAVDFAPSRIYGAISASFITNNWLHGSRQYVNVEEPVVFSPFLVKTEREQKVVLAVYAIAKFKRRKRPPNRTQKREGYVYDDVACGMQ